MVDLLQMRGISKHFRGTQALRSVDFSAQAGEVHAVVGENGAGKSTLMKILAGVLKRDSGRILLDDQPIEPDTPARARALGICMVQQEFSLVSHLSVAENLLMGRMPTSGMGWLVDWRQVYRRTEAILDGLGFVGINPRQPVSRLSVAQQQMVEIAKAAVSKPRILILDEPSAILSPEELKTLFALVQRLRDEGRLVLYISHRIDEIFELADRITVLKDGELVGVVHSAEVDQNRLIKMMVGRELSEIYPARTGELGAPILEVEGLSSTGAFRDISFTIRRGEVVGMFGLVGSGRTQIARCIFGADRATAGQVHLRGQALHVQHPRDAVQAGIAFLTEDRKRSGLVMTGSIRDNASLTVFDQISRLGVLNRRRQTDMVGRKARELVIRPAHIERSVRHLSGGNQQKVVLAKWLLRNADVLILDEPCRGVDIATKVEIYHLIRDLAARGAGILLISSEMLEVLGMSDRILVMHEGRLTGEVSHDEATEERLLQLASGVVNSQEGEAHGNTITAG